MDINIDVIVSIGRGGACPSRLLSDFLNIPIICHINVTYYDDIQKKRDSPVITQALSIDVAGKNVLVCDDVSDSGNSLIVVNQYLKKQHCASITTATLFIKPWTKFRPNFCVKQTEAWIVFPWERIETLKKLAQKYLNTDKIEGIKQKLLSLGFESDQVDFYFSIRTLFKKSVK